MRRRSFAPAPARTMAGRHSMPSTTSPRGRSPIPKPSAPEADCRPGRPPSATAVRERRSRAPATRSAPADSRPSSTVRCPMARRVRPGARARPTAPCRPSPQSGRPAMSRPRPSDFSPPAGSLAFDARRRSSHHSCMALQTRRAAAPSEAEIAASRMAAESTWRIKATPSPAPSPRKGARTKAPAYGRVAAHSAATALRPNTRSGRENEAAAIARQMTAATAHGEMQRHFGAPPNVGRRSRNTSLQPARQHHFMPVAFSDFAVEVRLGRVRQWHCQRNFRQIICTCAFAGSVGTCPVAAAESGR